MRDLWTIGPTRATYQPRQCGFAPREAERLVALKVRYDRGEFRELTQLDQVRFGRYLVRAGWFNDRGATRQYRRERPLAALHGEIDEIAARRRPGRATGAVREAASPATSDRTHRGRPSCAAQPTGPRRRSARTS